jgi:hypothetical protein
MGRIESRTADRDMESARVELTPISYLNLSANVAILKGSV